MRSFKRVGIDIEVDRSKIESLKSKIIKEFRDKVEVTVKDSHIIVHGDGLSDYRVHDKILYILTEGEFGANV